MNEITKAIKTRWDAKSLDDTVTGGIFHSRTSPARNQMPYVIFHELSSLVAVRTRRGIYTDFNVQFDCYSDDGDPETSNDIAVLIRDTMSEGQNAVADPLSILSSEGTILEAELENDVITVDEGEQVYRSFFTMRIRTGRTRVRTPA